MKIVCAWMYAIGKYGFPPEVEDIFRALSEMREMGFEYVELEAVGYENVAQIAKHRSEIRSACRDQGLTVSNFAVILPDVISMDAGIRAKALEQFRVGVETANYCESLHVWIDSYFPPLQLVKGVRATDALVYGQEYRVLIPDDFQWDRFWGNFVETVSRCNAIAKEFGIPLLLEPRVGEVISNTDGMLRLFEHINDANLGFILDIAHQHAQKEIIPLCIKKMGSLLKYVHVADNDSRENRHFEPGRGTVDWEEVFRVLKKNNFKGFFAIDLEKLPDLGELFVKSRQFLEKYAREYRL